MSLILPPDDYELPPGHEEATYRAVDALPRMSDEALERLASLFAAMDAEAVDSRLRDTA